MPKKSSQPKRVATEKRKANSTAPHGSGVIVIDPTIIPTCIERLKHGGTVTADSMRSAIQLVESVPDAAIVMQHPTGQVSVWQSGTMKLHPQNVALCESAGREQASDSAAAQCAPSDSHQQVVRGERQQTQ